MFDCKQDTVLLHSSLLSAIVSSNSDNLFDCVKVSNAVNAVYKSINLIIHRSLGPAKSEKEKISIQLQCNERLHAALFFTTLRSYGIKSQAADEFYDSILYNWPTLNLKFYVELNLKCDWSEYFVMCALQLPSETLLHVLKLIYEIKFEDGVECYSWHLILQTLVFKLLEASCNKEIHCPFDFDFIVQPTTCVEEKSHNELTNGNCQVIELCEKIKDRDLKIIENDSITVYNNANDKSNSVSDSGNESLKKENDESAQISNKITEHDNEDTEEEEDAYFTPFSYELSDNDDESSKPENADLTVFRAFCCNVYDNIALKLEESDKIDALKILLHAVKIISKNLKTRSKEHAPILPFENYLKLLKSYLSTNISQEKLKAELKKCSAVFTRHAYATTSWNVCLNYLIFLLEHYIEGVFPSISSCESLDDSQCKDLASIIHSLYDMNYPFLKSDEHIALLCKIIQFEFEGSSFATKIILSDPAILNRKNVLTTLEENCHVINLSHSYSLIIDCIMSTDSPKLKQSLLKILYTCLQMNNLDVYNTVIGYIITNYGLTEEFQLSNYNDLLSNIAHQTPTQEEIERKIPALLVQNPTSTLQYLIDEALLQGLEGKNFIYILKHFKNACFYVEKSGPTSILHDILSDYFDKPKLEPLFLKNMITLYKFLAEVHLETPILFPCDFFNDCLISKLNPDHDKIKLILECAYELVPALLLDESFLEDSEVFCKLIAKFGMLLNYFIENGNGEMKSLIMPILKNFEIHQQKTGQINEIQKSQLWSTFQNFDEVTCVYFEKFLPESTGKAFDHRAAVWIRYCKDEDLSDFETQFSVDNLTYTSLVNTLVQVLPHFTKKEWSCCFKLLKMCCTNKKVVEEITSSNNFFQLSGSELDIYALVSTIITSVHFVLNSNIDGSLYVSSCASNFLNDTILCEKTANPYLLLLVALEICYLVSSNSSNIFHIFHTTLLEIKKEICSHSSESGENDYSKLLNHAIACISNAHKDESNE